MTLLLIALFTPNAVADLVVGLSDPDPEVRLEVAERLAEGGGAGLDRLVERIQTAPLEERALLITALRAATPSLRVLDTLSAALQDEDAVTRSAAAAAAAGMEGAARPLRDQLRVALADSAPDVRIFATAALVHLVEAQNVSVIAPLLADEITEVRAAAAEALAAHGRYAAACVDALRVRLSQDEAPEVRAHAARALGRIGVATPEVLTALAASSQDPVLEVRSAARLALGLLGPRAASTAAVVQAGLDDAEGEDARAAAAWALGRMGAAAAEATPRLQRLALTDSTVVAEEALVALAEIGAVEAIGAVMANYHRRGAMLDALAARKTPLQVLPERVYAALTDPVLDTRRAAMRVVAPLEDPAVLPNFIARLDDTDPRNRTVAAQSLAGYGRSASTAIPALVGLLDDRARGVAEAAAVALIAIGPSALPAVERAFRSKRKRRTWAAVVLGALHGEGAAQTLRSVRHSDDEALRVAVAAALFGIDPQDLDALDALEGALTGPSGEARRQAALAVGRLGPRAEPLLGALLAALDAPELTARLATVDALGRFEAPRAERALLRALSDRDEAVRMAAAKVLARRPGAAKAAIPALTAMLSDADPRAGVVAARILGEMGPDAIAAVPALIRVDDTDRERLVTAADALLAIAGEPRAGASP